MVVGVGPLATFSL